ncbi:unnamed protein product [Calypogeia fissa]
MGEAYRFLVRVARSRYLVIAAAIWIECCSGITFGFSIYSQTIKDTFQYDQKHLDTLASWKVLGENLGVMSGLVFDWFSPQAALSIGIVQSVLAYLAMWLSVTGQIAVPDFWQMCLYIFFAANGQTFFSTACVTSCVQNFPRNRGVVIGVTKGFVGLSGALATQLYYGVYGNDPASFLLMASWLPSATVLILMVTIRTVPAQGKLDERKDLLDERRNLLLVSLISLCLALFLMVVILLERMMNIGHTGYVAVLVIIFVMLLLPFGVAVKSELKEPQASTSSPTLREPLMINNQIDSNPENGHEILDTVQQARKWPSRGEDHTIPEALGQVDFWLLFFAMVCGMGAAMVAIDNTGQIGASLGYSTEAVGTLVSLFCIWNFLGRLGFGGLSEWCLHKYQIGRPVLMAWSQACMCLGYVLVSSATPGSLYPALVIIGLCYGAQWSLMPAITSELFGLSWFATLFNTITIASPIGAYFLSVQVFGRLYDMEAAKVDSYHQANGDEDLECYGAHCFRLTFIILAGVSLFGCSICLVLVRRTKPFYDRILHNLVRVT